MIDDCTAVVFAGGQSRRMGEDKAGLVLETGGGQTLLDKAIACVQDVFAEVVVSVDRPRPGLAVRQICDTTAAAGPLGGLCAVLEATTTPWVFALATDMPFAQPALIRALAAHRDEDIVADAVVPRADGHPQPLFAFYSRACLPHLQARLARGEQLGLRAALAGLAVRYIDASALRGSDPERRSFFDLDTPQDLAAARQLQQVNR